MTDRIDDRARRLAFAAALLFFIGGLNGIPLALAMTGKLAADPEALIGAHLNSFLGSLWLLGLGWSLKFVSLKESATKLLIGATLISAYGNWIVTTIKAFLHVKGVEFNDDGANNIIAAALQLFVVVPTLIGGGLWVWGLKGARDTSPR